MINAADISLRNNRTVWVLFACFMAMGLASFLNIGRLEYPEFTIRDARITTVYPGRTTLQVEQEVTAPLEQALRQMVEIDEIRSTSKPGLSVITVSLAEHYFDLEPIWQDVRNRVAETQLPDGAQTPMINDDFGEVFPYVYALVGDGFSDTELLDYAEDIRDAVLAIDGVGKVALHGVQNERVYLEFSSSELAARGLSPDRVAAQLNSQNAVADSGEVLLGDERTDLVTLGEFESLDELAGYRLTAAGSATAIRVDDTFTIKRGYVDPPRSISHFNGERVVCIAVSMIKGGIVTEIGDRVTAELGRIQAGLPIGLSIEQMFYQPTYVAASINDFLVNLAQAFTFVVLVMLAFTGMRIAIIVGVLVPSAILLCFAFMPTVNVQLEMMSIAALIIALGLLVDNAVVVSEQVLVRMNAGESPRDAVVASVANLTIPLLAASGTTIAAFSTIALAPGKTSEFTYSLFAVVTLTLLGSWVLSLTVIPMLCFYFLRPLERETAVGRYVERLYEPYERLLRETLRRRWQYPVLILVLTLISGWAFRFVPNIFFPPNERGQFIVAFELPLGTDILQTEERVAELENWLLVERGDQVDSVSTWIGNGGPRWYLALAPEAPNPNYAFLSVLTKSEDPADVHALVAEVNTRAAARAPAARITAKALESGPPVGDPIQLRIYGPDLEELYALRERVVNIVTPVQGMYDVRDDWGAWVKQITIDPDPVRAPRLGLTTSVIARTLSAQFSGLPATIYREGDRAIPVLLRSAGDFRERPDRLPDIPIFGSPMGVVPLGQVAHVRIDMQPGSILREDTVRVMTVKGNVNGRYASEALAEIQPLVAEFISSPEWPDGYWIEYGGEQEESAEAQSKLRSAMPLSFSILALILISQFNSVRRFGIIVLTLPPMLIGVVPGLIMTGSSFGFMTLLGLIALLGIIVNNAILLIDEMDVQCAEGKDLTEAVVAASLSRLRPILITTITTIIGLLPLAISGGGMWSSMAYAMMFGLAFATVLTLLLCPVLYERFLSGAQEPPVSGANQ